jgi:hypothetical protein
MIHFSNILICLAVPQFRCCLLTPEALVQYVLFELDEAAVGQRFLVVPFSFPLLHPHYHRSLGCVITLTKQHILTYSSFMMFGVSSLIRQLAGCGMRKLFFFFLSNLLSSVGVSEKLKIKSYYICLTSRRTDWLHEADSLLECSDSKIIPYLLRKLKFIFLSRGAHSCSLF